MVVPKLAGQGRVAKVRMGRGRECRQEMPLYALV